MPQLSDDFLELQQKCEKVTHLKNQIRELQDRLNASQAELAEYQQEEENARKTIADDVSRLALEQLRIAFGLQSQLRCSSSYWIFQKEVEKLLRLTDIENKEIVFPSMVQQKLFLAIKNRLACRNLFLKEKVLDKTDAKVWCIEFISEMSAKNLVGSRINSQLLATDCEHGWKLTWMLDQPRLVWCPKLPREPVFNKLSEYDRFEKIKNALVLNGIIVGNLLADKNGIQHWPLKWNGQDAFLSYDPNSYGERWSIVSYSKMVLGKAHAKLTGIWENFELYQYLKEKSVFVDDDWYND
jgi:hypothetical protein